MWAENNHDRVGATFTFTLPLSNKKENNSSRKGDIKSSG
jgi:signal transduction histidine kinase